MANRKVDRGNYYCKVKGLYDIYHKLSFEKGGERKVTSDQWDIYHAKYLLEGGIKTSKLAIATAEKFFDEGKMKPRK